MNILKKEQFHLRGLAVQRPLPELGRLWDRFHGCIMPKTPILGCLALGIKDPIERVESSNADSVAVAAAHPHEMGQKWRSHFHALDRDNWCQKYIF